VLERLEQLGAAAVLTKTITPGELPAALQRIWRRRS